MGEKLWHDRKRWLFGLPWSFTVYEFDDERLYINAGLLKTVYDEVRLYRVLDVSLSCTLYQKIFNMGTIKVNSSDKSLGSFELKNIKNPKQVKEQLSDLVEKQRDLKRVSSRELMTSEGYDDTPEDDQGDSE